MTVSAPGSSGSSPGGGKATATSTTAPAPAWFWLGIAGLAAVAGIGSFGIVWRARWRKPP